MTPLSLPSGKVLNINNVTWCEWANWRKSELDGSVGDYHGLIVHFIGGTLLKLTGEDACMAALKLGL